MWFCGKNYLPINLNGLSWFLCPAFPIIVRKTEPDLSLIPSDSWDRIVLGKLKIIKPCVPGYR